MSAQAISRRCFLLIAIVCGFSVLDVETFASETPDVLSLGDRRELFVDDDLIDTLDHLTLELHRPALAERSPSSPEGGVYPTILHDGHLFRLYYRRPVDVPDQPEKEWHAAYYIMESRDGVNWEKPALDLFPEYGPAHRHMVIAPDGSLTHNFTPFIDTRPGTPADARYKALAGGQKSGSHGAGGLYAFVSGNGIHWRKLRDTPVIPVGNDGAASMGYFDSQNVAFWSESERQYVCYYRSWRRESDLAVRTISRCVSDDFVTWSMGKPLRPERGDEQFYTNQTSPYFRAPHIYIATPMRFAPWTDQNIHRFPSDTVLMTARGDGAYDRTFGEVWIAPPVGWEGVQNAGAAASLGIIPTSDTEMSIYCGQRRYVLRLDGFASLHAGAEFGEMITKPLRFNGDSLEINFATSAAGRIYIELQDIEGRPIPGFTLDETPVIVGDQIAHTVQWKDGRDLGSLAGEPIRLRIKMRDADLYAIRFK